MSKIEFYFSDTNLRTDDYLFGLVDGAANKPVPISTLHSFKRMRRFQPYSAIVAALKDSLTLEVVGDEGDESVVRKVALDPENLSEEKFLERSVYAKGFGEEEHDTQFKIETFFTPYGPWNAVRLRRDDRKRFKGSVFVEFADKETADKFLALDPKPKYKGETELEIMSKKTYVDQKAEDIRSGKTQPHAQRQSKPRGRGRGGNFRGNKEGGDRDPDDWKRRRDDDQRSGFRGGRGGRDRDGRGGGRGRGGRGGRGGRDDKGRNDRNREREESVIPIHYVPPKHLLIIHRNKSEVKTEANKPSDAPDAGKKRARDEDGPAPGESAPKKVDTKTEPSA